METLKIGLLGIGTVGAGVYQVLQRNQSEIAQKTGFQFQIVQVADKDLTRAQEVTKGKVALTDDALSVIQNPDIDIVIELIGGYTIAKTLVLSAIQQGKHVVTANKALLATQGNEIFTVAEKQGVIVAFEAAVAGGVPIIKVLREGLVANQVEWVAGIINGTTNHILSEMRDKGLDFATALQDAQRLGYAEADPTFDIEGVDAAHKITLLSAISFGTTVHFDQAYIEGITRLLPLDIQYAQKLGYRVKLLGITKRLETGIELRVHPTLIPEKRLLANIDGAMNGVVVKGDAVGPTLYYGAGAGGDATASSVIADLVDVARHRATPAKYRVPVLGFQSRQTREVSIVPINDIISAYYLRLRVQNIPGVLAQVTGILADLSISVDALIQEEPQAGSDHTDIALLTSKTQESTLNQAIATISQLDAVRGEVVRIRMEELGR